MREEPGHDVSVERGPLCSVCHHSAAENGTINGICYCPCHDKAKGWEKAGPHEHVYRCQDCGEIGAAGGSAVIPVPPDVFIEAFNLLYSVQWLGVEDGRSAKHADRKWKERVYAFCEKHEGLARALQPTHTEGTDV